jgi:hypothetical protein
LLLISSSSLGINSMLSYKISLKKTTKMKNKDVSN